MHAHEMISTHPQVRGNTNDSLIRCIEECFDCAQSCTSCADACLGEEMVAQLPEPGLRRHLHDRRPHRIAPHRLK